MLTILFRNPNFLILDEPTNDLDLPTLNVLENFLADFPGCMVVVSHDRYFMDKLVDHLFVFEGNGVIKDFPGNYTQYRLEEKSVESLQMTDDSKQVNQYANSQQSTVNSQQSSLNRKLSFKEKREFEQLEKDIAGLEAEKQSIEEQLSNPEAPFEKLNLLSHRINAITNELHQKEMRWLELSELA